MVEKMLGQAIVTETKWKMAAHEAVLSGIGAAFQSEAGAGYVAALQKVIDQVKGDSAPRTVPGEFPLEKVQDLRRALRGGKPKVRK